MLDKTEARGGRVALVVCLGVLLVSFSGTACSGDRTTTPTITIGGVLPLTGDAGTFGQNARRGAELAIDQANAARLFGDTVIRLTVEDSRGNAAEAASAARKLIDVSNVKGVIGDVTSAGTHALVPIAARNGVPVISPSASDPALSGVSPFFLRVWPSDVFEAEVIAGYAEAMGYQRIALLYANTDYGVAMKDQFRRSLATDSVVVEIAVDRETADYRPSIERIRRRNPDALFVVQYPEDARRLLDQLAERGLELPVLATATFEDPLVAAAPLAERVVFASPAPPAGSPVREDFVQAYRDRYGQDPGVLSDTGYDAAQLFLQALKQIGSESGRDIADYIRNLNDYEGASGTMSFTPAGDVVKEYELRTVRDARFVPLR